MGKRVKSLLAGFLFFFTILSVVPSVETEAAAAGTLIPAAEVTARIEEYMEECRNLYWRAGIKDDKLKKLTPGTYIRSTKDKPCPCPKGNHNRAHGCTSNEFGGGSQCNGFARYMQWLAFGDAKLTKIKASEVDEDFWDTYVFKPGDKICYQNGNSTSNLHFYVVTKVKGDNLYICHCNWSKGYCQILDGVNGKGKTLSRDEAISLIKYGKDKKYGPGSVTTGPVAVEPSYGIAYSANRPAGVNKSKQSGSMAMSIIAVGETTALRKNAFLITGYTFAGWNTQPDGSGRSYRDQEKVKDLAAEGKIVTLYAQWTSGNYLSRCKKTDTYLILTANGASGYTKMMSLPCTKKVAGSSKELYALVRGDSFTATAIYENTAGQFWYRVTDKNGKTGYIYGGAADASGMPSDALSGKAKLSTRTPTVGKAVAISGTLTGKAAKIAAVKAILTGSDKTEQTQTIKPNAKKLNLANSAIAKKLKFESLKHGPGSLKLAIRLTAPATNGNKIVQYAATVKQTVKFTEIGRYKVIFDANGGTGAPSAVKKTDRKDLTLPKTKPVYSGYQFLGWARKASATKAEFKAGGTLNVDTTNGKNMKLYAVWKKAQAPNGVEINEQNFPDDRFRAVISKFDTDGNGILSTAELGAVTAIVCTEGSKEGNIYSLQGIEYFTEITSLSCSDNSISTLDLSNNTKLTYVNCSVNGISSLNVKGCTGLKGITAHYNQLESIDLSGNPALESLTLSHNRLKTLDLSKNPNLTYLNVSENSLTSLNLSSNRNLHSLDVRENSFTKLDLSNIPAFAGLLKGSSAVQGEMDQDYVSREYYAVYGRASDQTFLYVDPDVVLTPTPDYPPEAQVKAAEAPVKTANSPVSQGIIEEDPDQLKQESLSETESREEDPGFEPEPATEAGEDGTYSPEDPRDTENPEAEAQDLPEGAVEAETEEAVASEESAPEENLFSTDSTAGDNPDGIVDDASNITGPEETTATETGEQTEAPTDEDIEIAEAPEPQEEPTAEQPEEEPTTQESEEWPEVYSVEDQTAQSVTFTENEADQEKESNDEGIIGNTGESDEPLQETGNQ